MTGDLIGQFCAAYHPYHSISAGRRVAQEKQLRAFDAYLQDRGVDWGELQGDVLADYLATLVGPYAASTVKQRLAMIRPFLNWLWERGVLDDGTIRRLEAVKGPRVAQDLPNPYNRREMRDFWRAFDERYPWSTRGTPGSLQVASAELYLARWRNGNSRWYRVQPYFKRAQAQAIFALAVGGGLRRVEIYGLTLEDIDLDNAYIMVTGARKNATATPRPRAVPWQPFVRDAVARWLDCRAELAPPHDFMWLSLHTSVHTTKPMRWTQFSSLPSRIGGGYEYHRLRHTFATEALRNGMPLVVVSKILGHSTIQQTMGYAQLLGKDVVDAADRITAGFSSAVGPRPTPV